MGGQMAVRRFDPAAETAHTETGQTVVEDHEVRRDGLQLLQHLAPRPGLEHLVAVLQYTPQRAAGVGVGGRQQDALALRGGTGALPLSARYSGTNAVSPASIATSSPALACFDDLSDLRLQDVVVRGRRLDHQDLLVRGRAPPASRDSAAPRRASRRGGCR